VVTKTILIVDDEQLVVQILDELLVDAGYTTLAARDGVDALAVLAVARPDLILTDLMMPRMDGLALGRALAADPEMATIPLVIMSAAYDLRYSIDFPIAGFLLKPFQFEIVLRLIMTLTGDPTEAVTP
jgi:CheY-like chemotaxis protein